MDSQPKNYDSGTYRSCSEQGASFNLACCSTLVDILVEEEIRELQNAVEHLIYSNQVLQEFLSHAYDKVTFT